MITNNVNGRNQSEPEDDVKPNAWRVEDSDNLKEKDLEKNLLFSGKNKELNKPVREGQGAGGQNFGENNLTPAGDDKNDPSQNAGYTNAYFARTEPSEEHPEDTNFTAKHQDGRPDYDKAQSDKSTRNEAPKPEKPERGDGQKDHPHPQEPYREGTADNEETNIPGPNELPDQQKVGEDTSDEKEHIEP